MISKETIIAIQNTPIGKLGIEANLGKISRVYLPNQVNMINPNLNSNSDVLKQAFDEINEYLDGKRFVFSLKHHINLSDFTTSVLNEINKIPYGTTKTYKEIAISITNLKASRAVGMACNKNPLPIIIPCHRVIGSNGSLVGYAGGLELKSYLLKLENYLIRH